MAGKGVSEIDFGAFPGSSHTSVIVPETGVSNHPTSIAEAWLIPVATVDHLADEHLVETIAVRAGACVAGVGFPVDGWNTSQLNEPVMPPRTPPYTGGGLQALASGGGKGTRLYGKWTFAWAWS